MQSSITRRQLVACGGVAAAAAAAAAGAAQAPAGALASEAAQAGGGPAAQDDSWIGSDPEIADSDIGEAVSCDVLVVGGGVAGSIAAIAALEEGASVVLVDKGVTNHVGGPACSMLNSKFQLDQGFDEYDPTQELYELVRQSNYTANTALLALWAYHSGEVLDWLVEKVIEPDPLAGGALESPLYARAFKEASPDPEICSFRNTGVYLGTKDVPDNMGDFIKLLHYNIESRGGQIRFQNKAEKLLQDEDGRVVGVVCSTPDGYARFDAARGVVMASGSFGHDEQMCARFLKPKIAHMFATHNIGETFMPEQPEEPLDQGDGHKMMCRIGAVMEQYPNPHNEYAQSTIMGVPFLCVNDAGMRFVNEAQSMLCYADLMCEQPGEEMQYWAIIPDDYATSGMTSTNVAVDENGVVVDPFSEAQYEMLQDGPHADTVEELAEQIGIEPATLKATVDRYNELCEQGADTDFGKLPKYLKPIEQGPFYADRATMYCCVTMGGVRCNGSLQVLKDDGYPIPGLYAAGNTVGQRFGAGYEGTYGGMTNAYGIVHGYFAGKNAATLG